MRILANGTQTRPFFFFFLLDSYLLHGLISILLHNFINLLFFKNNGIAFYIKSNLNTKLN